MDLFETLRIEPAPDTDLPRTAFAAWCWTGPR